MPERELYKQSVVVQVVREAFTLMGVPEIISIPNPVELDSQQQVVTASVHVIGSWNGTLSLVWQANTAKEIAARILGMSIAETTQVIMEDCLRELCNTVGGNLKPLLGHGALLSPPKLSYSKTFKLSEVGALYCASFGFEVSGHKILMHICPSDFDINELWEAHGLQKTLIGSNNMRILIVEDDLVSQKLMRSLLSKHGQVELASDGQEALELYSKSLGSGQPYDLICLDIMMPKLSGQETLALLRSFEQSHNIGGLGGVKVIMTSSLSDGQNVLGSFKAGCEAYLIKPIDSKRLNETLQKLFGSQLQIS